MAMRRRYKSSDLDPCGALVSTPGLEDVEASRDEAIRVDGEVRHGRGWRLGRREGCEFNVLDWSGNVRRDTFICHARIGVVRLIRCFDNPVKRLLCPPAVRLSVTIPKTSLAMNFPGTSANFVR
jgi:hypothetical protein